MTHWLVVINVLKKKTEESTDGKILHKVVREHSLRRIYLIRDLTEVRESCPYLGNRVPGRGNSQDKGPEVGTSFRLEGWSVRRDGEGSQRRSQKVLEQPPKATLSQVTVAITK